MAVQTLLCAFHTCVREIRDIENLSSGWLIGRRNVVLGDFPSLLVTLEIVENFLEESSIKHRGLIWASLILIYFVAGRFCVEFVVAECNFYGLCSDYG